MKNIATYTSSVEEVTDKIRHIVDNYMFENKTDQANIRDFVYDEMEFDRVKVINTQGHGKDIGFIEMRKPENEPVMLSDMVKDARHNGVHILEDVLFGCRSLYQGNRVLSTVGTHEFVKGESVFSIHKDLHGRFSVIDKGKERSLLHPFGREFVTLRDLRNTDRRPFKIYPLEMKDVTIAVIPRINSSRGMTASEDVNKDLRQLALKDFDIALPDRIFLSPEDFNPNIENQYSSNAIDKISIRNGRLDSFHMKDSHEIQCLSKSGLEKVENVVKSKMIYLQKFASDTAKEQERVRLFEKTRELQDKLAQLPGMEIGKTITLEKGIPLDDKVVVNSIGDMVVNSVTYLAKPHDHPVFLVSDGERDIPFSRMMEWNQEQVAEAVAEKLNIELSVDEKSIKAIKELMDEQHTDRIELPRPFGVTSKLNDNSFGQEAFSVVKDKNFGISLSDGKNLKSVSTLADWEIHELVNMVYEKPLYDLLKDGETIKLDFTADNSMSSGYKIDKFMFESITRHGDNLLADGIRHIETQGGQGSSTKISGFPIGCTKQVYDAVKPIIEEKRAEEKTYDSLEYDGKKWPLRSIVLPATGEQVLVGTVVLEQALHPDEWNGRKAQAIYERIFYYVEGDEINLPSEELAALVEREALDIDSYLTPEGDEIKVGMQVVWEDPEEEARDLSRIWTVESINGEVITIKDDPSVAEVTANELHLPGAISEQQEEDRLLSDADIAKQYSDFKVNGIKFYSPNQYQNDTWSGVVDLEFPNADHPDFDETMVNPFISYDKEGKHIAFDHWMPEETYKGVCDYILAERPKHLVMEAMIERTIDSSAKAFTPEQQQVILNYLKDFDGVDKKMQALSPLWEEACKDYRMDVYDEWKEPVKEELNDLASGIVRDNSRGRTP